MLAPTKIARAVALACALGAAPTFAAELNYSIYAGVANSDNINLSADQPISQNILIPGMNFSLDQQGAVLQATAAGNVEYRDYLGNRFSDQTQVQLAGQANWTVIPSRLDFIVRDYAGIQPVDRLSSNGPDNQQQTNVFAAGPTMYFRLADTLRAQAELQYVDSYAEKSKDFNSQRSQAALHVLKDLNATDQLSANIGRQNVTLDPRADNPDFDRTELYGRYVSKLSRFNLDLTVGWSKIDFDQAGMRTTTSPMQRVEIGWDPTHRSGLALSASRGYSDAAADMLASPNQVIEGTGRGINISNVVINSQVYLERQIEGRYTFTGERLIFTVAPYYHKYNYVADPTNDQISRGGTVNLDFRLRPTLLLSAVASAEKTAYDTLARRDRSTIYGVTLSQQRSTHWGWRTSFSHQDRKSNVAGQGYRENQVYFAVIYSR